MYQKRESNPFYEFENETGGQLEIGTYFLKHGQFGNIVSVIQDDYTSPMGPVPDGEWMLVNCGYGREVEIPDAQLDAGDTYTRGNKVYMVDAGTGGAGDILDAPAANTYYVGIVTKEKGTDTSIRIKTVVPVLETV